MRTLDDVTGLTAADLMHRRISTVQASATVGELRAYFAESTSHRVALLVDGDRYAGSIAAEALGEDIDDAATVAELADRGETVTPGTPAETARRRALEMATSRLPVVDDDGRLAGIIAINHARDGFCGT